jgi:hypothetical protein
MKMRLGPPIRSRAQGFETLAKYNQDQAQGFESQAQGIESKAQGIESPSAAKILIFPLRQSHAVSTG